MTSHSDDDPLARDPRFDCAWRAASAEEPPVALDDAIRATARREVGAQPRRLAPHVRQATRPERWWFPLAAAATIGAVAFGLLQVVGSDRLAGESGSSGVVSDVAAPATPQGPRAERAEITAPAEVAPPPPRATPAAPPAPAVPSRARSVAALPPGAADRVDAGAPIQAASTTPAAASPALPPAPAPAAAPARAPMPFPSAPATEEQRGDTPAPASMAPPAAPPRALLAAPAGSTPPPRTTERAAASSSKRVTPAPGAIVESQVRESAAQLPLPVPEWIARIRRLREEGRIDDARHELVAFRKAHPDHAQLLPPDLRDWAGDSR